MERGDIEAPVFTIENKTIYSGFYKQSMWQFLQFGGKKHTNTVLLHSFIKQNTTLLEAHIVPHC